MRVWTENMPLVHPEHSNSAAVVSEVGMKADAALVSEEHGYLADALQSKEELVACR
jgi:hypothetical protein